MVGLFECLFFSLRSPIFSSFFLRVSWWTQGGGGFYRDGQRGSVGTTDEISGYQWSEHCMQQWWKAKQNKWLPRGSVELCVDHRKNTTKPPVSTSRRATRYVEHRIDDRTHCFDHPRIVFVLKLLFLNFGVRNLNTLSDVGYFTYFVAYIWLYIVSCCRYVQCYGV